MERGVYKDVSYLFSITFLLVSLIHDTVVVFQVLALVGTPYVEWCSSPLFILRKKSSDYEWMRHCLSFSGPLAHNERMIFGRLIFT